MGPFPLIPISILNDAYSATFLKIKISNPIYMRYKLVWTFPAGSQSLLLSWLLHLNHYLSNNQTLKSLFSLSGSIGFLLLLWRLFYIEQNVLIDAYDQFHFLHKLFYNSFYIRSLINHDN